MSKQKRSNNNYKLIDRLLEQFREIVKTQPNLLLRFLSNLKLPTLSRRLRRLVKKQMKWVLRRFFGGRRRSHSPAGGFILPTIAILLLIFALVAGSILFRSANRSNQVVTEREQQVITNAATPAIERAKAKLEYLFSKDERFPNGLPSGAILESMLKNDGTNSLSQLDADSSTSGIQDPYTLPDETRLDLLEINNNTTNPLDNAWSFQTDADGDGELETVAYSIMIASEDGSIDRTSSDQTKANDLIIRNGPLSLQEASNSNCNLAANSTNGWDATASSSTFVRAFQITGVAIKNNTDEPNYAALELQQDREADLGNKWGAWFLNDLEIFPGPDFNWNGAMHTEGNLIVGNNGGGNKFHAYLISDPQSCLYNEQNSEITMSEYDPGDPDNGGQQFRGQMLNGTMTKNDFLGKSTFDIHGNNGPSQTYIIDKNKDGVESNLKIADRALDPVFLFTTGNKRSRGSNSDNTQYQDTDWENSAPVTGQRVYNQVEQPPFIDDTYRADDRYGPKPKYTNAIDLDGHNIGESIDPTDTYYDNLTNITNPKETLGYDGYWERRGWKDGLRVIVGQRLELGNKFGWEGDNHPNQNQDPLYPPDTDSGDSNLTNSCPQNKSAVKNRCHELRQWKTLRDNLAAVQATLVYHHEKDSDFPVACIATVAHPGTNKTIENSTTFDNYTGTTEIDTNFLDAKGTNGWEFAPPDKATFAAEIGVNRPLGKALRNLAHFAGDPDGAFPPVQETTGTIVHPYPYLTMWGDFSNLRRALDLLDSGTNYNDLSIADKTTIQTASCTLGMLAYNLNNIQTKSSALLTEASDKLDAAFGTGSLPTDRDGYVSAIGEDLVHRIEQIQQISRDRQLGFASSSSTYTYTIKNNLGSGGLAYGGTNYNQGDTITLNFDYTKESGNNFIDLGDTQNKVTREKKFIRLAKMLDTLDITKPKYPALYYIFPRQDHDYNGSSTNDDEQPATELYIADTYIKDSSVNGSYTYKKITDGNIKNKIRIQPRSIGNWELPNSTSNTNIGNKITDNTGASSQNRYVALLDKGMFNGREMMSVRTLDFDLNMLRHNQSSTGMIENWLPDSGIIYSFREDAMREDGIARPASSSWSNCDEFSEITTSTCRMNAVGANPKDPPVDSSNGISPKPIDFYADPDRRPYGFRLRNGQDIRRCHDPSVASGMAFISDNPVYVFGDGNNKGFNLHVDVDTTTCDNSSYSDSNRIEEFDEKLQTNFSNFYSRNNGDSDGNLNGDFARVAGDVWRPVEVLSDAVTIVGKDFKDGNIAQGIRATDTGGRSSYRTLNYPEGDTTPGNGWLTEDGKNSNDSNTLVNQREAPIKISRNGYPMYKNGSAVKEYGKDNNKSYREFSESKNLISGVDDTRINAVIISGLIPSRAFQAYGGLHNFPRFIETWSRRDLFISGSLLQLNFSTYATAPFDQDSWEPGNPANSSKENIKYYSPPNRRWGYDVGLQYAPAGPIAERFVTPSNARSEYYRELAADDPYVENLRCAVDDNNQQVDSQASCP